MKKILSLTIAFTAALSLSACAVGNNRINDRNRVGYGGIGTRRLSQYDISNINVNYRDGVYTGYGNNHRNGNESAVVEIRNGRIANINLDNVSQQGAANITTRTGGTTTTTPGTRIDNQRVTGNSNALRNTPGTTTDDMTGNTTGDRTGDVTGNIVTNPPASVPRDTTGNLTGTTITNPQANIPRNITGNITGNGRTNISGIGGTMGSNIGINTGTNIGTTLDVVKTRLVNMMIQRQSYDVNITNNDASLTGTINNWKLAVRRALDQARR